MDVSQIASLATNMTNLQTSAEASTLVLKKALDSQTAVAASLIEAIPQLPANPAVGRNVNTTA